MPDNEVKLERMSAELFLHLFPKDEAMRTIDEIISILDAGGYWDNQRHCTPGEKRSHIYRRLKNTRTHDGAGHCLFIPWPQPFGPTLYQFNLSAYRLHVLGVDEESGEEEWPDVIDG
jgi:hypothetical protein